MDKGIIALTHKHGMRQIRSLSHVISAAHVQRNKTTKDLSGKTRQEPQYLIRVKYKNESGEINVKEFTLKTHPDNIGVSEYNYIVNTIRQSWKTKF